MNRICVRAHDLGRLSAAELASRAKAIGFTGVQLVPEKALSEPFSTSHAEAVARALDGLEVTMLGGYFNPVHPDPDIVREGIVRFRRMLDASGPLGALYVGTETGSLMGSPWGYVPRNHAPETFSRVVDVVRGLADYAGSAGATVAIEGAWAHVAYSPEKVRELLDAVQSPNLKAIVDLFNFLNPANHEDRDAIFDRCLGALSADIVVFHLKDYVFADGVLSQVGLGKGLMDFPSIMRRIRAACPDARLVFEGVVGDDLQPSFDLISRLLHEVN
ncbi:MAG: sugar phosphate isomerase/epimerase family protein [Candidatus Izemoplasmatales bacterium]